MEIKKNKIDPSPGREGKKGIPGRRPNTYKSTEVGFTQGCSKSGEEGLRIGESDGQGGERS